MTTGPTGDPAPGDPVVVPGPATGRRPRRGGPPARVRATEARDRLVAVVGRLVPVARHVHHGITALVVAGGVAALLIGLAVTVVAPGDGGPRLAGGLVMAALLATPAMVLGVFRRALGEVLELPEKLRRYPDLVREHGPELAEMMVAARGQGRAGGRRRGLLGDLARVVRLLFQTVGDLPDKGALLPLVNVPFLIAVAASVVAVVAEVALAGFLLAALPLWLALH